MGLHNRDTTWRVKSRGSSANYGVSRNVAWKPRGLRRKCWGSVKGGCVLLIPVLLNLKLHLLCLGVTDPNFENSDTEHVMSSYLNQTASNPNNIEVRSICKMSSHFKWWFSIPEYCWGQRVCETHRMEWRHMTSTKVDNKMSQIFAYKHHLGSEME